MATLAEILGGGGRTPTPRPSTTTDVTGQPVRGQSENRFAALMQNPQMQSFMLNMAANLLGQQGVASSAAAGLEGMGRQATAENRLDAEREAETYRRQQAEQARQDALRKGSGGGGRGKSNAAGDAALMKRRDAIFKMLGGEDLEPGSAEQQEILARATVMAMAEAGDRTAFEFYNGLSPEARIANSSRFLDFNTVRTTMGAVEQARKGNPERSTAPQPSTAEPQTPYGALGDTGGSPRVPEIVTPQVPRAGTPSALPNAPMSPQVADPAAKNILDYLQSLEQ